MQYLLLVYVDDALQGALPQPEYDERMRTCFAHADALKSQGCLLGSQQLEAP